MEFPLKKKKKFHLKIVKRIKHLSDASVTHHGQNG
jgi:hypothetical protein